MERCNEDLEQLGFFRRWRLICRRGQQWQYLLYRIFGQLNCFERECGLRHNADLRHRGVESHHSGDKHNCRFGLPAQSGSVAADANGDMFIADSANNAIKEWNATTQSMTTLVSTGLDDPFGVAIDSLGNIYIADSGDNAIKEWKAASQSLVTIVATGLNDPAAVAVDASGNIYIADVGDGAIKEWNVETKTLSTLASSVSETGTVAVDDTGNVFFIDSEANAVKEWNATTKAVSTLNIVGLAQPVSVAVDGSDNLYIADDNNIYEWNSAAQDRSTVTSFGYVGHIDITSLSLDPSGNIYIGDPIDGLIYELPDAYAPGSVSEGAAAGSGALSFVLPANQSLTGIFSPSSDASWLTINSVSGNTIDYSFTQNKGRSSQRQHVAVGGGLTISQPAILATNTFFETATAGSGSVEVGLTGNWTASANAAWLHTTSIGNGDGTATFTFDANTGPMRTGTLTIAGQTLTVTQAAALGTTSLVEGPAAGSASDTVDYTGMWTATSNAAWLHIAATGSGTATFTFDANNGQTRTGTLNIAGATLSVTQAGSGYVAAKAAVISSSPLASPEDVAARRVGQPIRCRYE